MMKAEFCVFEYMYRDAGNWKTFGSLLLKGSAVNVQDQIARYLDSGVYFVAEQIGVPSLCSAHFADCGGGPIELDHAFHEYIEVRVAVQEDLANLQIFGSLQELLMRIRTTGGVWNVMLSPNC
jgi:hypothetical protein